VKASDSHSSTETTTTTAAAALLFLHRGRGLLVDHLSSQGQIVGTFTIRDSVRETYCLWRGALRRIALWRRVSGSGLRRILRLGVVIFG